MKVYNGCYISVVWQELRQEINKVFDHNARIYIWFMRGCFGVVLVVQMPSLVQLNVAEWVDGVVGQELNAEIESTREIWV
jgi:hypothetical protein